ncbi:MAG: ABC transporter substrate-binding protein, partial [Bryobacteraceae bacterium]
MKLRASVPSLDPGDPANAFAAGEQSAKEHIRSLIADRLVRLDSAGTAEPMLAASWQRNEDSSNWQFRLRPGVQWQDGSRVDGPSVAAALQPALKGVTVTGSNLTVTFQADHPLPDLLSSLAEARASVVLAGSDGSVLGSGAFRLTHWEAGRHAALAANENYWAGRPFLDGIDVEMGRTAREQIADFEL